MILKKWGYNDKRGNRKLRVMQSMTATLKRCSKDDASSDYMTESGLLLSILIVFQSIIAR